MKVSTRRWVRRLAWAHALTRTSIGLGMLCSPDKIARSWVGDIDSASARVTLSAFAIRDLGIGAGLLWSLSRGYPVRHWFALGTMFELVDVAAVAASRSRLPRSGLTDAWNVLGVVGMLGGVAVAATPDGIDRDLGKSVTRCESSTQHEHHDLRCEP